MLQIISEKCVDVLLKNGTIHECQKSIYLYGFELFWSTILGILAITIIGFIFGYHELAIIFLVSFLPLRTFTGGYHAKTYEKCFLLTNLTAIVCVGGSVLCYQYQLPTYILWIVLFIADIYIWNKAPFVSKIHPLKNEYISRNRTYARVLLCVELLVILFYSKSKPSCGVYTAVVTTGIVALMIYIAEREEGKL